ncbi:transposase [Streptomyces sp. RLB1-33]|nr:transposase [Streptomyces sp. RLB1-33]
MRCWTRNSPAAAPGKSPPVGRLPRSCVPGQLVLADREFLGLPLWQAFTATGAHLLWRVPANRILTVDKRLRDGSWLSHIHASTDQARRDPVEVRVLAYQLKDTDGGAAADDYRLVTSLLDARRYPARELAALYRERWEIESVLAEIKTHQRGARSCSAARPLTVCAGRSGPTSWSTMPCVNGC